MSSERASLGGRAVLTYAVGRAVPGIIGLLTTSLLARKLAIEDYGVYATIYAGVVFANMMFFHWVRVGVLRDVSTFGAQSVPGTFGPAYAISIAALASVAVAATLLTEDAASRVIFVGGLVASTAHAAFDHVLTEAQGSGRHGKYAALNVARALLYLSLAALAIRAGWGVPGVLAALITALGVAALIGGIDSVRFRMLRGALSEYAHYGFPLAASLVVSYALPFIDRWLVLRLSGPQAAAGLAGASDLTRQTIVVPMVAVGLTVLPKAFKLLGQKRPEDANAHLTKSWAVLFGVALPLVAGISVLSNQFAGIVLGREVSILAAPLIPAIAAATLAETLKHHYFDGAFALHGSTRALVRILVISLAVGITLRLVLIPELGAAGAVASSMAQFVVSLALTLALTPAASRMPVPMGETLVISVATALMVLAIGRWSTDTDVLAIASCVATGMVVYALTVITGLRLLAKRRSTRTQPKA